MNMAITYKKAGVDISEIKKSQRAIGKLIESTHNLQKKAKMTHGFGHYAGIVEIPGGKLLATHTDGVGTKVIISNMLKKYDTIGIDCIAMNVNDIICIGATPISFVDYIAANKNDQKIFKQIVSGLVKGAKKSAMPIVGGETAIMSDLISGKGFGRFYPRLAYQLPEEMSNGFLKTRRAGRKFYFLKTWVEWWQKTGFHSYKV